MGPSCRQQQLAHWMLLWKASHAGKVVRERQRWLMYCRGAICWCWKCRLVRSCACTAKWKLWWDFTVESENERDRGKVKRILLKSVCAWEVSSAGLCNCLVKYCIVSTSVQEFWLKQKRVLDTESKVVKYHEIVIQFRIRY